MRSRYPIRGASWRGLCRRPASSPRAARASASTGAGQVDILLQPDQHTPVLTRHGASSAGYPARVPDLSRFVRPVRRPEMLAPALTRDRHGRPILPTPGHTSSMDDVHGVWWCHECRLPSLDRYCEADGMDLHPDGWIGTIKGSPKDVLRVYWELVASRDPNSLPAATDEPGQ